MIVSDFLLAPDRRAWLDKLEAWEFSRFLADLRRHHFASLASRVAALEFAATVGLERFPDNRYVLAPALGALLDCGLVTAVMARLAMAREVLADSEYLMAVFGRALNMRGRRNSRDFAFRLVEYMKTRPLAANELAWLHERLDDPQNRIPGFFEPWPQGLDALERPERFDGVLQVPSLPNFSVRMVASKTQIERFATWLRNCLNSMTDRILSDQTRIIGIERDGHPYEAVEVNPRGGTIRQWKGLRNREADPATRGTIEKFLLEIGAIRVRRQRGAGW
jgi:hypothetical protein